MTTTSNIYLPLNFNQLLELIRQLPTDERRQLADLLLKEAVDEHSIPEAHKQLVRERIHKYNLQPELLIAEEEALDLISKM